MRSRSSMHDTEGLLRHLPFPLYDTAAVNAVFKEWYAQQQDADLKIIEVWTYCFIRRYVATKFMRDGMDSVSDADALIADMFSKARNGRKAVRRNGYYASWVSVTCRNTYLNYVRRRRTLLAIEEGVHEGTARSSEELIDEALAFEAVDEAIERLPRFLRQIARLRFLHTSSYEEISEAVDKPLPIIRSYVARAAAKIREDVVFLIAIDRHQV